MSNNKPSVKYQKVRIADVKEDAQNPNELLHPLESRFFWTRLYHYLFHVWVFELISIFNQESVKADDINDIRKLPKHLTVAYNHQKWMKMYNYRKSEQLSTKTLSMVYAIEKMPMLCSMILTGLSSLGVIYLEFVIVRDHLYPTMVTIATTADSNDSHENMDLLWDISKYALLLFIIAIFGCLCRALACQLDSQIVSRVSGCLQYQLYHKVLAIDMNEPDKKHVLSIVGAELSLLYTQFEGLLQMGPLCLFLEILLVLLLYKIVDNSAFFAFLVITCMCCFPLFIGARYSEHQTERLKLSAKRVQLISQLISGVRFLKCNASEIALMDKINEYRIAELEYGKKTNIDISSMFLISLLTPTPTLLVILLVYMVLFNKTLTVFTVVGLLMTMPMAQVISKMLPIAIGSLWVVYVTAKRMDEFLSKKERVIEAEQPILESNDILLQISNGFFAWNSQESTDNFMLKNIDLKVERGKLIAVIGTIGSGKTSLIQAILGEMNCVNGSINIESNGYGYCSQIAYIQNATLRENIVMDLPWDEQKYKQCIYAAGLESDLKQLPFGDLTEIGSEGINVSGGQRMRLCFARTLYRKDEYDLFLFDDPLSSVDIYVGKHMFFNGIQKYLRLKQNGKSALMSVNSHLYLLKYFDEIIILENGAIQLHIETSDLFNFRRDLHQKYEHLLPEIGEDNEEKAECDENGIREAEIEIAYEAQNMEDNKLYFGEEKQLIPPGFEVHKEIFKHSLMSVDNRKEFYGNPGTEAVKSNCRVVFMIVMTVTTFIVPSLLIFCDVWLVIWRENVDHIPTTATTSIGSKWITIDGQSTIWYLSVWLSASFGIIFLTFILLNYIANVILKKASHSIFSKALLNILKCNTLFFDIIPRGQILNVLSSDPNVMDSEFPQHVFYTVIVWSTLFGYFMIIAIITPEILLLCVLFVFPICYLIYCRIKKAYYGLIVLWKASLSPILSLFDESLSGLDSIRAYKLEAYFLGVSRQKIDTVSKYKYYSQSILAWAELYLNVFLHFCICVSIVCFGLLLLYFNPNQDLNLLLLSIWWYISFTRSLISAIHSTVATDSLALSIQKMLFYCHDSNIDSVYKSQRQKNGKFAKYIAEHQWPSKGDMNTQKLKLKYRKNFEIVLDIDREINIKRGTKLAVCGRTGSGKSSILVSIFRLFEPCIGSNVTIDEINIFELGLFDIRSNVSIIMQTPMIFTGTLRFNLDPFNEYSDAEIWTALKDVQLFALINNRAAKLQCEVGENGSNFSVGEAQLICFARAILKQTKILFMDEPTSSIDKQTDKVIQNLIRSERFADTTVICIAHRLQTILDYDAILLLEKGKILEYDKPSNLIRDKTSKFYDLLQVSSLCYKT